MTTPPSGTGNLPLPRWAYVPGASGKTGADYETLAQVTALVPPRFGGYVPARHPALRYGIMLNDRGYYWEAQEILQAVWAAAPQGGRERILLRACIQIAGANLKLRMQKSHAASRLFGDWQLRSAGRPFAFVMRGTLYFRAEAPLRAELAAAGSRPFTYAKAKGTVTIARFMSAPETDMDDPEALLGWARRALGSGA